jgi:hypothetical protein
MGASSNTLDSNFSGLSWALETLGSPGVLPGTPVWNAIEPNSYSSFGGQVKATKRETINSSRQKRKGVITGISADFAGQFDFTSKALYKLMPGFMFADWREKDNLVPSAVTSTVYTVAAGGAAFTVTSLLYAEGFAVTTNNGLKTITASSGTSVTPAGGLTAETPPSTALITRVGFQGATSDLSMTVVNGKPQLNSVVLDFTLLTVIPGEWVFIGGDGAGLKFATAICNGLYRVASVAQHAIVFDKWPTTATADAGTGQTLQVFLGHVVKNEVTPSLQKFYTFQWERYYNATNVEYVKGAAAHKLDIMGKNNDKVLVDVTYTGLDTDPLTASKGGTRVPILTGETTFNTATSFSRISVYNDTSGGALATYVMDFKLSIDNGIVVDEAITTNLGGIDLTAGDFTVSGSVQAYFSSIAAVTAVKSNADLELSFGMVDNCTNAWGVSAQGWLCDVPLILGSDARMNVVKDKPIMIPFTLDASAHTTLNHTLLMQRFAYLPQLAL